MKTKSKYGNTVYLKSGGVRRFVANRLVKTLVLPFYYGTNYRDKRAFHNKASWHCKIWDMSNDACSFQEYAEEYNRILNTKRAITKLSI